MTCIFRASFLAMALTLTGVGAHAAGRPYLEINAPLFDPAYTISYNGQPYASNNHYTPDPGRVLKATWANVHGTSGLMAAELGRLRVAEFGAGRATADDGSQFGVGGTPRQARFEDQLILQGAALNANTVLRVDYHLGGNAGGRIETNVDQGGAGRLDIDAELVMNVGGQSLQVKEHTWATQDVLAGGRDRTLFASSDVFDVTATGFSMRLGSFSPLFGTYLLDLNWRLSVQALCLFSLAPLPPQLPAPSGGCSYSADYGNTASFMGLTLRDGSTGALLDPASYSLQSMSGFDYAQGFAPPVPEPQAWMLMASGLALLGWRRTRRGR